MPNQIPKVSVTKSPAWHLEALGLWLDEWMLELKLRETENPLPHIQRAEQSQIYSLPSLSKLVRDFDLPVKVGQIRLLSPELTPDSDMPVFVAVFGTWAADELLAAPFGPLSVPATPGEWRTGRSEPVLRVLELWNTRSMPPAALNQSWLVDEFTDAECEAAWHVFEHDAFGTPLKSSLAEQVGVPLVHPRDPRRQYQHEQVEMLSRFQSLIDSLDSSDEQALDTPAPIRGGAPRLETESWRHRSGHMPPSLAEHALAASGEISPTAVEVLLVGEAGRIELFEQLGQPGFYRARVISDPLKELDGAEIISGEDQTLLVPLMAAAGTATFNGTCGILVRLADGRVMTPKKEAE